MTTKAGGGKEMTFRQFRKWCSERELDGCWSTDQAHFCFSVLGRMKRIPFWKRWYAWRKIKRGVIYGVVNPIDRARGCVNK